jgi:translation elongation factor EF-1beta
MGKVMVVMKVFPQEDATLERVLENVTSVDGINKAEIIDFVFGTKVIQASFITEDGSGRDFEEEVKALQGVSNVQVEEVGLIS